MSRLETSYRVGDLVKLPEDSYYWWGGKVGIVTDVEHHHLSRSRQTLRILVSAHNPDFSHVKFGVNHVELVNESR